MFVSVGTYVLGNKRLHSVLFFFMESTKGGDPLAYDIIVQYSQHIVLNHKYRMTSEKHPS